MLKSKAILLLVTPSLGHNLKKEILDLRSSLDGMLEEVVQDYTKAEIQMGR